MYKTSLNIGTLAGIIAFAIYMAVYAVGVSPYGMGRYLGFWVPILAVLWTTYKVRKDVLGGAITFPQAFSVGLLTILTWCTFKGFCSYIFITMFENHVLDQYVEFLKWYYELLEKTDNKEFAQQFDMNDMISKATAWNLMLADISNNILYGSGITLISALIFKKQPK
jgi:hypothetical protein